MKSLLTFFTSFFITAAISQNIQPCTIITSQQDTISGYLLTKTEKTNHEKITFKRIKRSKITKTLAPEELISVSSNDQFIISLPFGSPKEFKLFRKLLSGYVDLYSSIDASGKKTFYIQREGEELFEVGRANLTEFIEANFSDCQSVKIKNQPYYEAYYLKNVISSYNACAKPDKYVYVKSKRGTIISTGVKAGVSLSTATVDDYNSDIRMGLLGGVFVNASFHRLISIQLEFLYNRRRSESERLEFKTDYIQVPILLQFSLSDQKFAPFVNVGFNFNYAAIHEINYKFETESLPYRPQRLAFGLIASAGVPFKINAEQLFVGLRADLINNQTNKSTIVNGSLQLSLSLILDK